MPSHPTALYQTLSMEDYQTVSALEAAISSLHSLVAEPHLLPSDVIWKSSALKAALSRERDMLMESLTCTQPSISDDEGSLTTATPPSTSSTGTSDSMEITKSPEIGTPSANTSTRGGSFITMETPSCPKKSRTGGKQPVNVFKGRKISPMRPISFGPYDQGSPTATQPTSGGQ